MRGVMVRGVAPKATAGEVLDDKQQNECCLKNVLCIRL